MLYPTIIVACVSLAAGAATVEKCQCESECFEQCVPHYFASAKSGRESPSQVDMSILTPEIKLATAKFNTCLVNASCSHSSINDDSCTQQCASEAIRASPTTWKQKTSKSGSGFLRERLGGQGLEDNSESKLGLCLKPCLRSTCGCRVASGHQPAISFIDDGGATPDALMMSRVIIIVVILMAIMLLVVGIGLQQAPQFGGIGVQQAPQFGERARLMGATTQDVPPDGSVSRSLLLDNAKLFAMFLVIYHHILVTPESFSQRVPQPQWLHDSRQLSVFVISAITKVHLPMFCVVSGILSQSAVSPQRIERFLYGLCFPVLIWVYFAGPVVGNTLVFPSTFFNNIDDFVHLRSYSGLWYVQALMIWRCSAFLLWSHLRPAVTLPAVFLLSVFAGYSSVGGVLQSAFGFLPYFGVGLVLPFKALESRTQQMRSGPIVFMVAAAVVLYLIVLLPVLGLDRPWPSPYSGYYFQRPFPTPELYERLSFGAKAWNIGLVGIHRLALEVLSLLPTLALLFFVIPRRCTMLSWAAPYTLHQYAFHIFAHIWLIKGLSWGWFVFGLPPLTSSVAHVVVLLMYVPYCMSLIAFFSSSPWRKLWAWCFQPDWLQAIISARAIEKNAVIDKTRLFSK